MRRPNLEDVYVKLTGEALNDAEGLTRRTPTGKRRGSVLRQEVRARYKDDLPGWRSSVPVAASNIPEQYKAAVIGIVAIMAGTFGSGESLTIDLNDGILVRVALTPFRPQRIVFEVLAVNAVLDFLQLVAGTARGLPVQSGGRPYWVLAATFGVFATLGGGELHRHLYRQLHHLSGGRVALRHGDTVSPDLPVGILPQPAPHWHPGVSQGLRPVRLHERRPKGCLWPGHQYSPAGSVYLPNDNLRRAGRRRLPDGPAPALAPYVVWATWRLRPPRG